VGRAFIPEAAAPVRRGLWVLTSWVAVLLSAPSAVAAPPSLPLPPMRGLDADSKLPANMDDIDRVRADALLDARYAESMARAGKATDQRRWRDALGAYKAALDTRPNDPRALLGEAKAWKSIGGKGGDERCPNNAIESLMALEMYDPQGLWRAQRGTAVEWMLPKGCDNVYASDRLKRALDLAEEAPDALGRPADIRLWAARWLRDSAIKGPLAHQGKRALQLIDRALEQLQHYFAESRAVGRSPNVEGYGLQGQLYRERGQSKEAVAAYSSLLAGLVPGSAQAARVQSLVDELELELTVADLQRFQGNKPKPEAELAYNRGVQALRDEQIGLARTLLEEAVKISPLYPKAYYYLGEVYSRTKKLDKAIDAYNKAIAMKRYDYASHVALGLLYRREYFRTEDEKALKHLGIALSLRQDLHILRFYLGELEANRDKEQAREHFQVFIEHTPAADPLVEKAREALRGLERQSIEARPFLPPIAPDAQALLDPELHRLLNEAYVLGAEQGDWDRAEKSLLRAREKFPNETALLNRLASVVDAQQRPGDARMYWQESLAVDSEQTEVHERLGIMLDTEEGLGHLRKAASLGSMIAHYKLANRLSDQFDLLAASEQLDIYLREAGENGVYRDSAVALRSRLDSTFLKIYVALGLLLALVLGIPSGIMYRRLRGSSLTQLLERSPKSFPEIARILSLIRHEILKHNTAFLSDVGSSLEKDAPDSAARASLLARRLFGERDPSEESKAERRGIHGRFLGYVDELQKVGTSHGVTLNLRRKDPIFSTMMRAFRNVAEHSEDLWQTSRLRPRKKMELGRVLLRSGDVLGRRAFERLSGLIRSLCVARVDAAMIEGILKQVLSEDQFASILLAPLEIEGEGEDVRIFRTDLEDILVNVFRNSLHSSLKFGCAPVVLGVSLVTEIDEITGLTSLAIRIKDRSPERLTNEMLRGRYVERGMGITADLLSKYDGSITVESEDGWEKAVVLRFFVLEENLR